MWIFRSHRSTTQLRPIATDVARSVLALCLSLSLSLSISLCLCFVYTVKNTARKGCTDRDTVWGADVHPRNHVLDGVEITPRKRIILGVVWPVEKHWESLL